MKLLYQTTLFKSGINLLVHVNQLTTVFHSGGCGVGGFQKSGNHQSHGNKTTDFVVGANGLFVIQK